MPDFRLSNNVGLPKNTQDLTSNYYLQKVQSQQGGHKWELNQSGWGALGIFMRSVQGSPDCICQNRLSALMEIAANPTQKHLAKEHIEVFTSSDLEALFTDPEFQQVARSIPGMETAQTKFKRAACGAAKIGKGLADMEKTGVQGKILSPSYMIEVGTQEHWYGTHDYFNAWQASHTHLNFEDWMKWNYPTANIHKVTYLDNEEERAAYKLDFKEGKVLRNQRPFDTAHEVTEHSGPGFAIFVIDSEGSFYAGSHIQGQFHHSSFLSGAATIGAGEIQTDAEGSIKAISNKSGHYKPGDVSILNTLKILQDAGVDLSTIKFTKLTAEGSLIYSSAKEYLEANGHCSFNGYESFTIESNSNGNYALTLHDQTLSKPDYLQQLNKTKAFLESKFQVNSLTYKETLRSGQVFEYPVEAYLQSKGNLLPTKWEGGTLHFENQQLKRITIDPTHIVDSTKHEHFYFLQLLEFKGINLSTLEIEKDGCLLNGLEYLKQLNETLI